MDGQERKTMINTQDLERLKEMIRSEGLSFYIETYGCQMNAHDSEKMGGILLELGYRQATDKFGADIVLFNTCCVRENAENKIYGNVDKLKQVKKQRPHMIIGVCGCMMQQKDAAAHLFRMFPFVDMCFGTTNMQELPEMIAGILLDDKRQLNVKYDVQVEEEMPMLREQPPLASVNIMQGCNNFCSYCIVPYVRGREHSRPMKNIVKEVEFLIEAGYREVLLLGQNVNSYGNNSEEENFPKLLEEIAKTGIDRIRFMSSHPKDAGRDMFEIMARYPNICKQLHLPVQSGSTSLLKRMNRKYSREHYLDLIREVREIMPDIKISTDIMIGFPGETEEEFLDTLSLMREVRYDSSFDFVYSPRKGTPAASMPDQIPEDVKQQRIMQIVALQSELTFESNLRNVGKTELILIEGKSSRDPSMIAGKTDGGVMVNCRGDISLVGEIIPVKITEAKKTTLIGERI